MNSLFILFLWTAPLSAPSFVSVSAKPPADTTVDRAGFLNEIARFIVDSSFTTYYLSDQAYPCSFVKYDYDEWVKYALQEDLPIYTLNELAGAAYSDRKPETWTPGAISHATCVDQRQTDSLLNPAGLVDSTLDKHRQSVLRQRIMRKWSRLPAQQRVVYFFSRPVFTKDGQFAVIDLSYRCDSRLCGLGTTCIFRRTAQGWILVARKINWQG